MGVTFRQRSANPAINPEFSRVRVIRYLLCILNCLPSYDNFSCFDMLFSRARFKVRKYSIRRTHITFITKKQLENMRTWIQTWHSTILQNYLKTNLRFVSFDKNKCMLIRFPRFKLTL